jgi:hypothetical protein
LAAVDIAPRVAKGMRRADKKQQRQKPNQDRRQKRTTRIEEEYVNGRLPGGKMPSTLATMDLFDRGPIDIADPVPSEIVVCMEPIRLPEACKLTLPLFENLKPES